MDAYEFTSHENQTISKAATCELALVIPVVSNRRRWLAPRSSWWWSTWYSPSSVPI